jgi:hypothetical protein
MGLWESVKEADRHMVKKMIVDEELPGLASGCWEFDVLMEPKGEKCSLPHLFRAGRA